MSALAFVRRRAVVALGWAALACAACGDDAIGEGGALVVRASGEASAKQGYPYERDGVEFRFVDGWTLVFDRYLVSFGDIEVATRDGETGSASGRRFIADLKQGDPVVEEVGDLEPRRWDSLSFSVLNADASSELVGQVRGEDADRMRADGLSYLVEGVATHPEKGSLRFSFAQQNATRNRNCTNGLDGTDGVIVRENATTEAELTFHVDHLFWDTLGAEQARLRFDPIWGADRNRDGFVDLEELAQQRLADLQDPDGEPLLDEEGEPLVYDPGAIPLADKNLREFLLAASASQAHLNGLGLCSVQRL
jgi:hypothetical protein